jgi:hypothetical protein
MAMVVVSSGTPRCRRSHVAALSPKAPSAARHRARDAGASEQGGVRQDRWSAKALPSQRFAQVLGRRVDDETMTIPEIMYTGIGAPLETVGEIRESSGRLTHDTGRLAARAAYPASVRTGDGGPTGTQRPTRSSATSASGCRSLGTPNQASCPSLVAGSWPPKDFAGPVTVWRSCADGCRCHSKRRSRRETPLPVTP